MWCFLKRKKNKSKLRMKRERPNDYYYYYSFLLWKPIIIGWAICFCNWNLDVAVLCSFQHKLSNFASLRKFATLFLLGRSLLCCTQNKFIKLTKQEQRERERAKKMLFQVGGQGTRPTFFEMAAAQQLPASLRAALTYSIGVSSSSIYSLLLFLFCKNLIVCNSLCFWGLVGWEWSYL